MQYRSAHGVVLGGIIAVSTLLGRDLSSLAAKNPFAETSKVAEAKPAEAAPTLQLELRGIVRGKDGYLLNVYDAQAQKSHWVRSGDRIKTHLIGRYDALQETLSIEAGGQSLTLALKTSRLREASRGPVALATRGPAPIQVKVQVAVAPPQSEIRRMEELAQQVRQRRELLGKKT